MFREQKFFYSNLFLNPELIDEATLLWGDAEDGIAFDASLAYLGIVGLGWR
jgi:hypothetical protein